MSKYDDIRDDLSALVDGALDPDRRREVETALEGDPALRAEFERLRNVDKLYAELPRDAAPAGFVQGVRKAIASRETLAGPEPSDTPVKVRPFARASRNLFWSLATAAMLLAGFFLWSTANMGNRSKAMLSMAVPPSPAGNVADTRDDRFDQAQAKTAEKPKAEVPAAAAPALPATAPVAASEPAPLPAAAPEPEQSAVPEAAEKKAESRNTPPPDGDMPLLEALRKQDRERALNRALKAKQAAPVEPTATVNDAADTATVSEPGPESSSAGAGAAQAEKTAAESAASGAGPQGEASGAKATAEQRRVAGRVFLRSDSGWVDQAYKGEVLTPLEMDSDEYKGLLPTHPPLEKVAELGGTITLRIDGVWRDLKTGKPAAESK